MGAAASTATGSASAAASSAMAEATGGLPPDSRFDLKEATSFLGAAVDDEKFAALADDAGTISSSVMEAAQLDFATLRSIPAEVPSFSADQVKDIVGASNFDPNVFAKAADSAGHISRELLQATVGDFQQLDISKFMEEFELADGELQTVTAKIGEAMTLAVEAVGSKRRMGSVCRNWSPNLTLSASLSSISLSLSLEQHPTPRPRAQTSGSNRRHHEGCRRRK